MSKNIDLFGWDTAYAISFYDANKAIEELDSTPPNFNYKTLDSNGDITSSISGDWDHWSISTKSDGQNLVLRCPIKEGEFTTPLEPSPININDSWIEVEVQLAFIESEENLHIDSRSIEGTGDQLNLQLQKGNIVVTSSSFDFTSSTDPSMIKVLCETVFVKYFEDHIDEFNHVFSIFVLNQQSTNKDYQWLKPTNVHYAITSINNSENEETNLRKSTLGVMCMTEGREPPISGHAIDPNMLEYSESSAAFAISGPLFVKKWLLAGVEHFFDKADIDDFKIKDDSEGLTISNNKEIIWDTFENSKGGKQQAKIPAERFSMTLTGEQISIEFDEVKLDPDPQSQTTIIMSYSDQYQLSISTGVDSSNNLYKNSLQLDSIDDTASPKIFIPSTSTTNFMKDIVLGVAATTAGILVGEFVVAGIGALGSEAETAVVDQVDDTVDTALQDAKGDSVTLETSSTVKQMLSKVPQNIINKEEDLTTLLIKSESTGEEKTLEVIGIDSNNNLLTTDTDSMNSWKVTQSGKIQYTGFWYTEAELGIYTINGEDSLLGEIPRAFSKEEIDNLSLTVMSDDGKVNVNCINSKGQVFNDVNTYLGDIDEYGQFKARPLEETGIKYFDNTLFSGKNLIRLTQYSEKGLKTFNTTSTILDGNNKVGVTILGVIKDESGNITKVISSLTDLSDISEDAEAIRELMPENYTNDELSSLPTIKRTEGVSIMKASKSGYSSTSEIYGIASDGTVIGRVGNIAGTIDENLKFVTEPFTNRYESGFILFDGTSEQEIKSLLYSNTQITLVDVQAEALETEITPLISETTPENLTQSSTINLKNFRLKLYGGLYSSVIGGITIADLIVPYIQDKLNKGENSKVPSLDEFGQNCLSSVKWPNSGGFELQTVSLNSCLLLGGDLLPEVMDNRH
ncbi:TULIP family P47-like protein [Bacillus sp. SCS-151]|uniref:TULIP family P47-like protein n=1 Tax=Nanhaiella sioensis TaxID=3115293 RepID=UPI00397850BE